MNPPPFPIQPLFELLWRRAPDIRLRDPQWRELLAFADRTQTTLYLRDAEGLPEWFHDAIQARTARNIERRRRLNETLAEISGALARAGVEWVLLKGQTHETGFGVDPEERVQYDLDLLCPQEEAVRAEAELYRLGYVPHGAAPLSDEHSRPLVRPSAWQWRGDYFDPDMPIPVEVHTSVWSAARDRIALPGMYHFWSRRTVMEVGGLCVPALCKPDRLGVAGIHALSHVLRNDARLGHMHELARFLDTRADDARFWQEWRDLHDAALRRVETAAFCLAARWFPCKLAPVITDEGQRLGRGVAAWLDHFAWSPVLNLCRPDKNAIWLHMALLSLTRDRLAVLRERLAPLRLPGAAGAAGATQLLRRARYHATALAPALVSGLRWWWHANTASAARHTSA